MAFKEGQDKVEGDQQTFFFYEEKNQWCLRCNCGWLLMNCRNNTLIWKIKIEQTFCLLYIRTIVPSSVIDESKKLSMEILNKWDSNLENFLWQIVTGDKTCLYQYNPKGKAQSKLWLPKGFVKAKTSLSGGKDTAIIFWDAESMLLVEFGEKKVLLFIRKVFWNLAEIFAKMHQRKLYQNPFQPWQYPCPFLSSNGEGGALWKFKWKNHYTFLTCSPGLAFSDVFPDLKNFERYQF